MTMREQVALAIFGGLPLVLLLMVAIDAAGQWFDSFAARKNSWRAIDIRCSMENHPSFRATLYDWEMEDA